MSTASDRAPLLSVEALRVGFGPARSRLWAVDDVDLTIQPGESVGLVGESGCGKTTLGRSIMRLVPAQAGRIRFDGQDVRALSGAALRAYRKHVQMVFQDPYGSLNARIPVGQAIEEVLQVHRIGTRQQRQERVADLFQAVGLDPGYRRRYPHEFSGGQRQRIGLARALAVAPQLVIADEPVSALDVSVQVQILNLMKDLQRQMKLAYLFVAHDLAVVRYLCDRIYVMYLGKIVESGPPDLLFSAPRHPYTQALLAAVPDVDKGLRQKRSASTEPALKGDVGGREPPIGGCRFEPRCPLAQARCRSEAPVLEEHEAGHHAACHFARS